jgi:hypothetical protein
MPQRRSATALPTQGPVPSSVPEPATALSSFAGLALVSPPPSAVSRDCKLTEPKLTHYPKFGMEPVEIPVAQRGVMETHVASFLDCPRPRAGRDQSRRAVLPRGPRDVLER